MIDRAEADRRAAAKLRSLTGPVELAWYDGAFGVETVSETEWEWVYHWNSAEFLRTGEPLQQIPMGSIVVPKDGSQAFTLATFRPEEEMLRLLHEEGGRANPRLRG